MHHPSSLMRLYIPRQKTSTIVWCICTRMLLPSIKVAIVMSTVDVVVNPSDSSMHFAHAKSFCFSSNQCDLQYIIIKMIISKKLKYVLKKKTNAILLSSPSFYPPVFIVLTVNSFK